MVAAALVHDSKTAVDRYGAGSEEEGEHSYYHTTGVRARRALKVFADALWWTALVISNKVGQPRDHCNNWFQQTSHRQLHHRRGYNTTDGVPPIVEWVTRQVNVVAAEFDALLVAPGVWDTVRDLIGDASEELTPKVPDIMSLIVLATLEAASHFGMRHLYPTRSFPLLLCWMVFQSSDVACPERQRCARDLIEKDSCDPSCNKIAKWFRGERVSIAETGRTRVSFWHFILDICWQWSTNAPDLEVFNGLLKFVSKMAANLTWRLMCARALCSAHCSWFGKRQYTEYRAEFVAKATEVWNGHKGNIEKFVSIRSGYDCSIDVKDRLFQYHPNYTANPVVITTTDGHSWAANMITVTKNGHGTIVFHVGAFVQLLLVFIAW